ncbi:LysM peptidoglycan-binding domain-containing protein [uncultured Tateyamaria sp.]|uniref:LysM peptidoglycan-binding domain-containing protein n=1 Tax=uncultured Tateyamaria sp. TaxID=455651 RepID=UPI0026032849|nr:LysM peptidoglycan-binding domain-containing protein [uncultured Tateyamaria sp.]
MSKWAALAGSNGVMVASATAVAVAAIGAGVFINNRPAQAPVEVAQPADPEPQVITTPAPEAEPEVVAETPETPPSIDEVRVEADGLTIVAGRASPGSEVSVLLDGVENTSVTADAGGGFAAITMIVPKPTAQVLTIVQRLGDRSLPSVEEIILAPTAVAQPEPAPVIVAEADPAPEPEPKVAATVEPAATPEPTPEVVATAESAPEAEVTPEVVATAAPEPVAKPVSETPAPPAPVVVAETPQPTVEDTANNIIAKAITPAPSAPPSPSPSTVATVTEPLAQPIEPAPAEPEPTVIAEAKPAPAEAAQQITVLKSTADGVEVLGTPPEALDSIAIDTISYSDVGDVQLAGRAQSEADAVRVYVDNRVITELPVDPDGRWRGDLPDIDTGVYTLRVDEVDATGDVTSRVETPFRREDPAVLTAADRPEAAATQVTVQTGTTLWAIARERYGEGRLFVQVFEANRDSIRDPNLIYPGQVFALPN